MLKFISHDLAADRLGQLRAELHNPGILIRSGVGLDVILDLLLHLFRTLDAGNQNDAGLDDLAADLVGRGADTAFQDIRQLHDGALDLERPDAVAGGLDDVVGAANIPVVAVLIPPCHIAGVIQTVVPDRLGGSSLR